MNKNEIVEVADKLQVEQDRILREAVENCVRVEYIPSKGIDSKDNT